MSFPYKKILLIGATSGIGRGLAESLVTDGRFIIAVGRRQKNLDDFVAKHGPEKVEAIQFDISKLDMMHDFAKNVINSHPDLDCIFVNSGIQRRAVFSQPETIDMDVIQEEVMVNYVSYLALTKEFLPFFAEKHVPTSFIFTSSNLALVPILRCSNYCATKAALHQWILCLREQLRETNTKVIEIFPPIVQTELHDAKHQPDIANGASFGIPVDKFVDETMQKLLAGEDQIPIGISNIAFNSWEKSRQQAFVAVVEAMKKSHPL